MSEACRQRYKIATGQKLEVPKSPSTTPKFAKGGRVPPKPKGKCK
jgi:hypothetical protein